jgi:flagellar protein FlgJ
MATDPLQAASYNDVQSLVDLRRAAQANDPKALRETARQFESVFTRMMLQSMRKATQGDTLFDSNESGFYRDMFDDQLSVELSKGRGLGLADMLVQQLQRSAGGVSAAGASVPAPATAGTAGVPAKDAIAGAPADFVRRMMPLAEEAGRQLGVSPRTVLAHAALETGWGKSTPTGPDGSPSFNLFGIKSGSTWAGRTVGSQTTEYESGAAVSAVERFRGYDSAQAGVRDYVALLGGSARYAAALGQGSDVNAFASALQKGGYATDPRYAQKLTAVAATVDAILDAGLKSGAALPIPSEPKVG